MFKEYLSKAVLINNIGRPDRLYVSRLKSKGLWIVSSRTFEEIVSDIAGGTIPDVWDKKKVNRDIAQEILNIMDRKEVPVHSDLVMSPNLHFFSMLIPVELPKIINNWREARDNNCLRTYFGINDIFHLFTCVVEESVECIYNNDYFDYVNHSYTILERVDLYITYLKLNKVDVPTSKNSYSNCLNFVTRMLGQVELYGRVISQFPEESFDIVSDGAGTLSVYCISENIQYSSSEPNNIGYIAKQLNIIRGDFDDSRVLVAANCDKYSEVQTLLAQRSRVIVIDESCSFVDDNYQELGNTAGKVWIKGLNNNSSFYMPSLLHMKNFVLDRQPVMAADIATLRYFKSIGVESSPHGFKMSLDDYSDSYNLVTRGMPGNLNVANRYDTKIVNGEKFVFEGSGQVVQTDNELFSYHPRKTDDIVVLDKYVMESHYYVARVRNPRRIKYARVGNTLVPLYFAHTYMPRIGEKVGLSFYVDNIFGVRTRVKGMNIEHSERSRVFDPDNESRYKKVGTLLQLKSQNVYEPFDTGLELVDDVESAIQ